MAYVKLQRKILKILEPLFALNWNRRRMLQGLASKSQSAARKW